MISVSMVLILIWLHFVCDFILQTDQMAKQKSTSNKWLTSHVIAYTIPFMLIGVKFAVVNGILHFITDYISSRISSKMWSKGEVHWFFVVIGADQAIHISTLLLTAYIML